MRMYTVREAKRWLADRGVRLGLVSMYRLAEAYGTQLGKAYYIPERVLLDLIEGKISLPPRTKEVR